MLCHFVRPHTIDQSANNLTYENASQQFALGIRIVKFNYCLIENKLSVIL